MSRRAHILATLALAALFLAYGAEALTIPLFPGQEHETFKPRTMPVILAAAGAFLCMLHVMALLGKTPDGGESGLGLFEWRPAILLCIWMILYGALLIPAGFVAATTLLLAAGFATLGERRWKVLLLFPFLFSLLFYLLMSQGLGLYLAPGIWTGA